MPKAPVNAREVVKAFEKISAQIDVESTPGIGKYLVELIKNKDEFARFKADPDRALEEQSIDPKRVNIALLQSVAQTIVGRLAVLRDPSLVADSFTNKESSSAQERNFDNSASWFWNKDGYNVLWDAGHTKEKTTGQEAANTKDFGGQTILHPGDQVLKDLNRLFFPAQPLVTPELVDKIKAAVSEGTND